MIKILKVKGLNDNINCELYFNSDLNILTGKNGSGKTTILKLIWYLISGNIERIFREIAFELIYIESSDFALLINNSNTGAMNATTPEYNFKFIVGDVIEEKAYNLGSGNFDSYVDELNRKIAMLTGESLFFPTFRRVEGGIIPSENENRFSGIISLEEAMMNVSDRMSVYKHKFISSISTRDIISLITRRYADVSELTNKLHSKLSENISEMIQDYKENVDVETVNAQIIDSNSVLQNIKSQVDEVSATREQLLRPFSTLSSIVDRVFDKSIKITESITFGGKSPAIVSDKLSAGEKQMLSFFCYNAFYKNSPIFIDEPELSLHTDWQSTLFPNLLKQANSNQFIIATHSPFIYSKYSDKEIMLNEDKGE